MKKGDVKVILLNKKHLLNFRYKILVLLLLVFIGTFVEGINITLFYPLMEYVQNGEAFFEDSRFLYLVNVFDFVGISHSVDNFLLILLFFISFSLAFVSGTKYYSAKIFFSIGKEIRDDCFKRVVNLPMTYFLTISSGKLVSIIQSEVEHIVQTWTFTTSLVINSLFVVIYGVAALYMSWKLTLIVIFMAILNFVISGTVIKKLRTLGDEYTKTSAKISSYLINIYQGIDVVKTFGTERNEVDRLKKTTERFRNISTSTSFFQILNSFAVQFVGVAFICLIIYSSVSLLQTPTANLLLLLFIIFRIVPKVAAINDSRIRIAEYTGRIVYIKDILAEEESWEEDREKAKLDSFSHSIIFDKVSFRYPGSTDYCLSDIGISISKNEMIAVVGESGAGKTTFVRMLLGLYEAEVGNIFIDDTNINDISPESRKNLISMVSQDTFIFDDTIKNNIIYGSYACSDHDFLEAVQNARADDFINRLPNKENEFIGERGIKLSGGQRQRIAIARAFLNDTPILVLDEATSALDSVTEEKIQQSLEELGKNRTLIVIAHRLSTIKKADRIVVFDKGAIVEIGTNDELIANGGLYKRYHDQQKF